VHLMRYFFFTFINLYIWLSNPVVSFQKIHNPSSPATSYQTNNPLDTTSQQKIGTGKVSVNTLSPTIKSDKTDSIQIKKPDDLRELIYKTIGKMFGSWIFYIILVIGTLFGLWEKRKDIKDLSSMICSWIPKSVPKADPKRYSVFIADLENDHGGEIKELILDDLRYQFKDLQILSYKRNIRSQDNAKEVLGKGNGEVLIWGKVLRKDNDSVPKLFWTISNASILQKQEDRYPITALDFSLPELFWNDLSTMLQLLVAKEYSEFTGNEGHYTADIIEPYIEKVRELLYSVNNKLDAFNRNKIRIFLAGALNTYGKQSGINEPLLESIETYREVLKEYTQDKVPLDWATTQNNLGNALSSLGERENGTKHMEEAMEAYRETLKERTREKVPLDWAMTQNNLGKVLRSLGERESGTKHLEEAVEACREALKERTREKVPLDWAMTQNNLGNALSRLGERESGTKRLEEAVEAFREALKECTQEKVPLDWAMIQNNLGAVLRSLGERESGTKHLEEAVEAYRGALKERMQEKVPLDWAMTQNNLGAVLRDLGERESGTKHLEEAVEACREALKERTREKVPLDWAMTQNNLGNALAILGEREGGTKRLEEAIEAFREALKVFIERKALYYHEVTKKNIQIVLEKIKKRKN
jgi:tetratricopeptide (TPR) repeat protein